jgi:biopolymer transport protein ExbD
MAGGRIKGHMHRTVYPPGYRIKSKYDLSGFRSYIEAKKTGAATSFNLPLTPLIDLMSILVIYLLMNFSATGEIFFINKDQVVLPNALHARPLESLALISILKDRVIFEAQQLGGSPIQFEETDLELPQLRARLQQLRVLEQQIHPDKPFKGLVNIQADQDLPLEMVKRTMTVLISEGWTGINFATMQGVAMRNPAQQKSE